MNSKSKNERHEPDYMERLRIDRSEVSSWSLNDVEDDQE